MHRRLPSAPARRLAVALTLFAAGFVMIGGAQLASAGATPAGGCTIAIVDDSYTTGFGQALTVDDPGVVANDEICNTDGLVISLSSPTHGELDGFDDSGGGFTYTPDPGFSGTDSFTYTLEDVETSQVGTVSITVGEAGTTTTEGTTTTTGGTTTTTGESTSTTAAATTTTSGVLAVTGSHDRSLTLLGLSLVAAGVVLTAASRRRSRV